MSGIKDQEQLKAVRKRLYERGDVRTLQKNHELGDVQQEVRTSWQKPPEPLMPVPPPPRVVTQTPTENMAPYTRKKGYRTKILIVGFVFFVLALVVSSAFLLFGRNNISGENITIVATGPFTIGGGEDLQLQVGITNDNGVPIGTATLIIEYPNGTQSSTVAGKDLFTERVSLDTINQGETINVPIKARVFGEENEEKLVKVSIEYRVQGSNATFFKEAEPLRFKISSSPVIVRTDAIKKISSGQETDITLTLVSNSPTPLSEVLIKAEYPTGFDFTKSSPAPTHSQNMWLIKNLEPEQEQKIVITGVVIGKETDEYAINFTVGVANQRDPQSLASVFATTQTQFEIEQPFLDIDVQINASGEEEIAVKPGERARVFIEFTNSLEDTLNDISIEVQLTGNAVSLYEVSPSGGYYDPSKNTVLWDVANTPLLRQLTPGESTRLSLSIEPASNVSRTPQIGIDVNAKARRVSERQVAEVLVGTVHRVIKVISVPKLFGVLNYNNGIFTDTGPTPPVSDIATTYTMSMVVENGSNEITNALVSASLPAYVTWLDKVEGVGKVSYNPVNRAIEWDAGDVAASAETYVSFQVSMLPRALHIGTIPTILGEQRLKAIDRFTGTTVRTTSPSVTSRIPSESGDDDESGRVRAKESQ